jgi:hypothetical protein
MQYQGAEYTVIQSIERGVWKWSVSVAGMVLTGHEETRPAAVAAAEKAIDRALRKYTLTRHRREGWATRSSGLAPDSRDCDFPDLFSFAVQHGNVPSLGRWRIRRDLARDNRRPSNRFLFIPSVQPCGIDQTMTVFHVEKISGHHATPTACRLRRQFALGRPVAGRQRQEHLSGGFRLLKAQRLTGAFNRWPSRICWWNVRGVVPGLWRQADRSIAATAKCFSDALVAYIEKYSI